MELAVKNIKSIEPDIINNAIYGTFKNGEYFKINVPGNKNFIEVYDDLKSKIYGAQKKEVVSRKRKERNKFYKVVTEEGESFKLDVLAEILGYKFHNMLNQIRRVGSYKGEKYKLYVNGKKVDPTRKKEGYKVRLYKDTYTGEEHTMKYWVKKLGIKIYNLRMAVYKDKEIAGVKLVRSKIVNMTERGVEI